MGSEHYPDGWKCSSIIELTTNSDSYPQSRMQTGTGMYISSFLELEMKPGKPRPALEPKMSFNIIFLKEKTKT